MNGLRVYRLGSISAARCAAAVIVLVSLAGLKVAQAEPLYGITAVSGGKISLVQVNTNTGAATFVKEFTVPSGFVPADLAYDSAVGKFLTRADRSSGDPPRIGIIDPAASALQVVAVSGLPSDQQKINGIEYWAAQGSVVLSFGPLPNTEDRIAKIDLSGTVLQLSANMGLGDRDILAQNPMTGDLLAIDFNDLSPRLAIVRDPFGTLSTAPFANPPEDRSLNDVAISYSGQVFASRVIGDNELVRINVANNDYSTIGMFGTTSPVVGLAFVPEPSSIALALAGVGSMALRIGLRRRSQPAS